MIANTITITATKPHTVEPRNGGEVGGVVKDENIMSSTELFKKHFGESASVGLSHPNMESFFNELNQECLRESILTDAQVEAAHRWYIAHYQHVNRLIDSMEDKLSAYPPTDKSNPELWKAAHWNWFLNPSNTTK